MLSLINSYYVNQSVTSSLHSGDLGTLGRAKGSGAEHGVCSVKCLSSESKDSLKRTETIFGIAKFTLELSFFSEVLSYCYYYDFDGVIPTTLTHMRF